MALRNVAARMRTTAAAALRFPPPGPALRVSPPAGTRPSLYTTFQGGPTPSTKLQYLVTRLKLEKMKKDEEYLKRHVQILEFGKECLSWSFKLLLPIPFAGAILKVTR